MPCVSAEGVGLAALALTLRLAAPSWLCPWLQVTRLQSRVDELTAAGEISASAVHSLEATLAAIERAEARRTAPGGQPLKRGSSGQNAAATNGSKRVSRSSSQPDRQEPAAAAAQGGASCVAAESLCQADGGDDDGMAAAQAALAAARAAAAAVSEPGGAGPSAAGLSRELVKTHMAAADVARKLRVAERCVPGTADE